MEGYCKGKNSVLDISSSCRLVKVMKDYTYLLTTPPDASLDCRPRLTGAFLTRNQMSIAQLEQSYTFCVTDYRGTFPYWDSLTSTVCP